MASRDNDWEIEADDEAEVIYKGSARIGTYARTNGGNQVFTITDLDENQFKSLLHNVKANTPIIMISGVGSDLYFDNWNLLLKKASEGIRTGPNLRFEFPELDDDSFDSLRDLKEADAELFVVIIKGEILVKEKPKKGQYGMFAKRLMQSPLLTMPEFWQRVGSENDYESWLRKQPCALTGGFHKDPDTGEEKCEVAHVREISFGAGTSRKPPYYAIPLHHDIHLAQHQQGIHYVWNKYGKRYLPPDTRYPIPDEVTVVKLWFMNLAHKYIRLWVKDKVKQGLNVTSLTFVSPEMFQQYLDNISARDLERFL